MGRFRYLSLLAVFFIQVSKGASFETSAPYVSQSAAEQSQRTAFSEDDPCRDLHPREAFALSKDAYVFGYPLVTLGITRSVMTNVTRSAGMGRAPLNQFAHVKFFPMPFVRTVVRPNIDTLYSSAWLDLESEPVVLTVPEMGNRYYVMPLLDAWSRSVTVIGSRTTNNRAQKFIIAGPGWRGVPPTGMSVVRTKTNFVWLLNRIFAKDTQDLPAARMKQAGFTLVPLSYWQHPSTYQPVRGAFDSSVDMLTAPKDQVERMTGEQFLTHLAALLSTVPANDPSERIRGFLRYLGLTSNVSGCSTAVWGEPLRAAINAGVVQARREVKQAWKQMGEATNGWRTVADPGNFGADYLRRSAVAWGYLGIVARPDAFYAVASTDINKEALHGSKSYRIRFSRNQLPPTRAFWSVTLYDEDGFLVHHDSRKYGLNSGANLYFNADGSLDVIVQAQKPRLDSQAARNWIPAPEILYNLALRIYGPRPSASDGRWTPPAIEPIAPVR